jgi:hypothetical protein
MNLKEHLQFLIMMIPTLLLLVAVAATLASPARAATEKGNPGLDEIAVVETEIGPVQTVVLR